MENNISKNWDQKFDILIFNKIDSTNEEAKRLLDSDHVSSNTLIWAETQTNGKGRLSRIWHSNPGNLTFSLIFKNDAEFDFSSLPIIPFLSAVALGEVICENFNVEEKISYKWPNDVLFSGKKLAGILSESSIDHQHKTLNWLIMGMGVNIFSHPTQTSYPATNLFAEGITISSDDLLDKYIQKFLSLKSQYYEFGFGIICEKWLNKAAFIGEIIQVSRKDEQLTGKFWGIDKQCNIKLELPNGQIEIIQYGDIVGI